jgi:CCR4-NOT transcriptional regulation complex NOT5 subunit
MNSDTYEGSTQEAVAYQHLQGLREKHQDELENIVRVLASITNISPEQVKPYMENLLRQLVNQQEERPFSETATASEWVTAFREWAASHHHDAPPLSDYAVSRESIYEDENL